MSMDACFDAWKRGVFDPADPAFLVFCDTQDWENRRKGLEDELYVVNVRRWKARIKRYALNNPAFFEFCFEREVDAMNARQPLPTIRQLSSDRRGFAAFAEQAARSNGVRPSGGLTAGEVYELDGIIEASRQQRSGIRAQRRHMAIRLVTIDGQRV